MKSGYNWLFSLDPDPLITEMIIKTEIFWQNLRDPDICISIMLPDSVPEIGTALDTCRLMITHSGYIDKP